MCRWKMMRENFESLKIIRASEVWGHDSWLANENCLLASQYRNKLIEVHQASSNLDFYTRFETNSIRILFTLRVIRSAATLLHFSVYVLQRFKKFRSPRVNCTDLFRSDTLLFIFIRTINNNNVELFLRVQHTGKCLPVFSVSARFIMDWF